MQSARNQFAQLPAAVDTRLVLRVYAVLVGLAGFVLAAWGQIWIGNDLPGFPWGLAALVRVFGSIVMAFGFCAAGLAVVESPSARRRAVGWFCAAHVTVLAMLTIQARAIPGPGWANQASWVLLAITLGLLYVWDTAYGEQSGLMDRLFFRDTSVTAAMGGPSTAILRSRYEQQIRETAGQEERNRLARDLHDSIKQQLFVIHTAAATAEARFEDDRPGSREAIRQIRESAREAVTEMEAMLDQLRAVPLELTGLVEALRKQCDALGFRTGARVAFTLGDLPPTEALAPGAAQAVFRVAQEALANVGRHARARLVTVALGSEDGELTLTVTDDGAGFEEATAGPGMGRANMEARARDIGARFSLMSATGKGTTLTLAVPYVTIAQLRSARRQMLVHALCFAMLLMLSTRQLVIGHRLSMWFAGAGVATIGVLRYGMAYRGLRRRESAR